MQTRTDGAGGGCPVTGQQRQVHPGPKGWPIVGPVIQYFRDPLSATLRMQRDHGPLVWVRMPRGRSAIQITSPTGAKHVLARNHQNYRRGLHHAGLRDWMGKGLTTLDGEEWRSHRKVLQAAFTAAGNSRSFPHLVYGVEKQMETWAEQARTGEYTDLFLDANKVVSRGFTMALIGRDYDPELTKAVAIASESVFWRTFGLEPPEWVPTRLNRRKRWAKRKLEAIAQEMIAKRSADDDREDDVVGLLLRSDLGPQAFRDNLLTIMLAGSDTTGAGLAFALWELATESEARRLVEGEVDSVLGGRTPTEEDLDQLVHCRAFVEEVLRLHPPLWIMPRQANEDDVIDGCPIEKDTSLFVAFFGIHRNPEYWPNPNVFDHRRFLQGAEDARRAGTYMPFGTGKHQCIARDLALTTMTLAVAMFAQRFRIEVDGTENFRQEAWVTLRPHPDMKARIHERPWPDVVEASEDREVAVAGTP